jgi:thioredoxin-related protein
MNNNKTAYLKVENQAQINFRISPVSFHTPQCSLCEDTTVSLKHLKRFGKSVIANIQAYDINYHSKKFQIWKGRVTG